MATEQQQQLMYILAAIIEEAGGEIWIPEKALTELDDTKKIYVEYDPDAQELYVTLKENIDAV